MQTIERVNQKNSIFQVVYEDTDDFKMGIYTITNVYNPKTRTQEEVSLKISTLTYIEEKITTETRNYYKVVFYDRDVKREQYIDAKDLLNTSTKNSPALDDMISKGLIVYEKCRGLLIEYYKTQALNVNSKDGTEKAGWRSGEYIGNGLNTSDIVFAGDTAFRFQKSGSEEQYKQKLASIFAENPLVFAICSYCISCYILPFLGNEVNQTLALNGLSSKGKSSLGRLALSMLTHPKNYQGLNQTKNNMVSLLHASNHNFVFFDEVAEINLKPEERKNLVYIMANGSERGRLEKSAVSGKYTAKTKMDGENNQPIYTILIAGEKSFLEGVQVDGTGIDARYIELVLPKSMPLWDSINTAEDAEALSQFINLNYGHIAEDFINLVKSKKDTLLHTYTNKLSAIRNEMIESDGIIKRKVRILAYSNLSSMLLGELLWGEEIANEMADVAYLAFKKALFTDNKSRQIDQYKEALSHIQDTLARFFEMYDYEDKVISNQSMIEKYGFIKVNDSYKCVNVIPHKFKDVCVRLELDEGLFFAYLKENNLLRMDKDRNTKKIRANGVNSNYYVISIPHKFFDEIDTSINQNSLLDEIDNPFNEK